MALKDLIVKGPRPPVVPRLRRRLEPVGINNETWFYDDKKGILVIHEFRTKDTFHRTDQFIIPWAKLRAALQRRDALLAQRKHYTRRADKRRRH